MAQWGVSKARLAQVLMNGLPEDGRETIVKPNKPNTPKYKVGQHIRFASIYNTPDDPTEKHINADQKWTQVGTITQKLDGRKNLYKVENSGKLLGYVNDGDIVEIWNPSQPTAPSKPQDSNLVSVVGTFTTDQSLPLSPDSTVESPASAWYDPFESMEYDGYVLPMVMHGLATLITVEIVDTLPLVQMMDTWTRPGGLDFLIRQCISFEFSRKLIYSINKDI